MNAEAPKRAEEIHLFPLLEEQFPVMAKSYRENLAALAEKMDDYPNLQWYNDEVGPLFFRLDLDLPALFILSEPLSRFQAHKRYVVPIDTERSFYADLGIIPVYFANLNRISCVKLWGGQASNFFAPYSQPFRREEDVTWRLDPVADDPAQLSSMNFILKHKATENEVHDPIRSVLSDYFKYAFWSFPRPGFACCAHIIHSRENINHVLKVAKSIYVIKRVHEPRAEWLAPYYSAWVQRIEFEVFDRRGQPRTLWAYMARDVVKKIESETGSRNSENVLINGLIYEFKDKAHPSGGLRLLSVVADFLPSDVELFKTLAGLSAAERFYLNHETFGQIGSVDELRSEVDRRYRPFLRRTAFSTSFFDRLGSPTKYIVDELYPIVVQYEGLAFFVHPVILSALMELDKADIIEGKDVSALVKFIRLLQKCGSERGELLTLRFTDEAQYFKDLGVDFSDLRRVLLSAMRAIRISKLLSECL